MFTGPQVMPVNVVAPYLLTALIERPKRIVYLSSSMHFDGVAELNGVDWLGGAAGSYSDSKLFVTALAAAVARLWPDVISSASPPTRRCTTRRFKRRCWRSWRAPAG